MKICYRLTNSLSGDTRTFLLLVHFWSLFTIQPEKTFGLLEKCRQH